MVDTPWTQTGARSRQSPRPERVTCESHRGESLKHLQHKPSKRPRQGHLLLNRSGWIAITVDLPAHLEDQAIAAFWEAGCLGVEGRAAPRRPHETRAALEAWFPGRAAAAAVGRRVIASLAAAGVPVLPRPRVRRVADGRWVEAWQKTLKPMPIGRRLLALPEGADRRPARTGLSSASPSARPSGPGSMPRRG